MFEATVRRLDVLPRDESAFGLIHFDFASDNVFREGDRICAIDFDDAARSWYAADIAFARDGSESRPLERTFQLLDWFLAGYRNERPLDRGWLDHLEDFVRFEAHRKLARLLRSYRDADAGEDLKWLAAMRQRHVGMVEGLRQQGESAAAPC